MKRETVGHPVLRSCTAIVATACLVTLALSSTVESDADDFALYVSVDDAKVNFLSGNFSVAVTRDWPRVIFKHEGDLFSPTFEVSCPRMYMFNDTNGDHIFDMTEVTRTVFLDSNHVQWNLTDHEQGYDSIRGVYAMVGLSALLNTYIVADNETEVESGWATLRFYFSITENPVVYSNTIGEYTVNGRTSMRMNFSLEVHDYVAADGIVLEHHLQGGGSTNMFDLYESLDGVQTVMNEVEGTVDERDLGDDFTNDFMEAPAPAQMICFSRDDGTQQAFYHWGSEAAFGDEGCDGSCMVDSSYFTTGAGMTLHSIYAITNETVVVAHASSLGIIEEGFIGSVSDWMKENLLGIALVVTAVAVLFLAFFMRRRVQSGDQGTGNKPSAPG